MVHDERIVKELSETESIVTENSAIELMVKTNQSDMLTHMGIQFEQLPSI